MKKQYILFTALFAASMTIASQKAGERAIQKNTTSHLNQSGAPTGRTGAPGELTCATSGCHTGTVQDGTAENVLIFASGTTPVSSYLPGQTYNVALSMTSNPPKKGFQATVLDVSNNPVGTLTASVPGGTALSSGAVRKYINHTTMSSTSSLPWAWTWTAPAVDAGPIRFYVATNKTNSNGQSTGDVIYTSVHPIGSTASINEVELSKVKNFNASFSAENSMVYITYNSLIHGTSHVNIIDLNGRSVYSAELDGSHIGENKEMIRIPSSVKNGMYVVHFFVDNVASSKSISIQR